MPLMNLNLKTLDDLDERVAAAFMHELKRVVLDCQDRPGDKNARKVVMETRIIPRIAEDGDCEDVEVEFQIKSSVPTRKTKTYTCRTNRAGQLIFSSTNPEDVEQTVLDDLDPETGKINRNRKD